MVPRSDTQSRTNTLSCLDNYDGDTSGDPQCDPQIAFWPQLFSVSRSLDRPANRVVIAITGHHEDA